MNAILEKQSIFRVIQKQKYDSDAYFMARSHPHSGSQLGICSRALRMGEKKETASLMEAPLGCFFYWAGGECGVVVGG